MTQDPEPSAEPDIDSITLSRRLDEAFDDAPGQVSKVAELTRESRFFNAIVHDTVGAISAIGVALGLTATCILAVALEVPGVSLIAATCGTGAVAVVLAVVLGQSFKPFTFGRTND